MKTKLLTSKKLVLLVAVIVYLFSSLFAMNFATQSYVIAATKNDGQLRDYIKDNGACGGISGDCEAAFIDVYKNRRQVGGANDSYDSKPGGLAERYCISKKITPPELCVSNTLAKAFILAKTDNVGGNNPGGGSTTGGGTSSGGGSGSSQNENKEASNPPKAVQDEADKVCGSEQKRKWKQGERPDCRTAFIFAFLNREKFTDGSGKVDSDYIRNTYCSGTSVSLETCVKGATQGATIGIEFGGDAAKLEAKRKSDGTDKDEVDCDAKVNSPLSWIICPIIDMGVGFTDWVFDDFVKPMLEEVPVSTNPEDGSYQAWSQFRVIANILLIGSLLAIVYSQAKGEK